MKFPPNPGYRLDFNTRGQIYDAAMQQAASAEGA
jgi:hypothetical protein